MLSEKKVRTLHRSRLVRKQPRERLLHGSVTRGVARLLGSKPETRRYVSTIGWHRRERDARAKQEDLVDSRIADGRKAFERFSRLLHAAERTAQIAAKFLEHQPGCELETRCAQLRNDAARFQCPRKRAAGCGEDGIGGEPDAAP